MAARWVCDGWRVDQISLRLAEHTSQVSIGGSANTPRNGQQFRVVRVGMVDYVRTVKALQTLMGDDFEKLVEVKPAKVRAA